MPANAKPDYSYPLKHNRSTASPGQILVFDTEAWWNETHQYVASQYQRLRLGCALTFRLEKGEITRKRACEFSTQSEFWAFLESAIDCKRPLWVFAHNIGYDATLIGLPEKIRRGEWQWFDKNASPEEQAKIKRRERQGKGFLCLDDPPVILQLFDKWDRKTIWIDTFNYWSTSLRKIGDMVGCQKTDMPLVTAPDSEWFRYCWNDVAVLTNAVVGLINWVKENDMGKFRFTAPGQAMAAFRHRWNDPKIILHNNEPVRKLEREAYYGGRLECFYIGEVHGKIYELDVTSLYPSVMYRNLFPKRLRASYIAGIDKYKPHPELGLSNIATVKLKTKYGFPQRDKSIGTVYPIGEYWTTLAGPELVMAQSMGIIRDVASWATYDLDEIFTGFVDHFWNYRKLQNELGNELNSNLAKLLMNGLYGKFGQLTNEWIDRPDIPAGGRFGLFSDDTFANSEGCTFRDLGTIVQQLVAREEHPQAFPAIAAYVTSYGREVMRSLMAVAGTRNVYYCVTDGLFVNQAGYDAIAEHDLLRENELGYLRVKHFADVAEFRTLHHYNIGEHRVTGSRKKNARENSDGSFTEIHFEKFSSVLHRKPDGTIHVKPVTKTFSLAYNRGSVNPDGFLTPLIRTLDHAASLSNECNQSERNRECGDTANDDNGSESIEEIPGTTSNHND